MGLFQNTIPTIKKLKTLYTYKLKFDNIYQFCKFLADYAFFLKTRYVLVFFYIIDRKWKWYFVTKIVLTYCEKELF